MTETAMGVQMNAQKNPRSEYVQAVHFVGSAIMERSLNPLYYSDFIFNMSETGKKSKRLLEKLHAFTNKVIKERKSEIMRELADESNQNQDRKDSLGGGKKRRPFMDVLIHEHLQNPTVFTEANIREEVDTFMFEGHDTTGWGVTWALYLVGLHPEVQQKCHEELDEIFGSDPDREVTLDDLRVMKYLECVIKESQRLYPSVPLFGRTASESFQLPVGHHPNDPKPDQTVLIEKGTQVVVMAYHVHRCADHWIDPETFNPDRFLPANSKKRHPYSYIPFSAGPRNCIGQKFAMNEEKSLMTAILRKFKITSLDERDVIKTNPVMILKSKSPIKVKLEQRSI